MLTAPMRNVGPFFAGEKHPQIIIEDKASTILDFHHLPAKARIEVEEGQQIKMGQMLARQPKEVAGSADIVGIRHFGRSPKRERSCAVSAA